MSNGLFLLPTPPFWAFPGYLGLLAQLAHLWPLLILFPAPKRWDPPPPPLTAGVGPNRCTFKTPEPPSPLTPSARTNLLQSVNLVEMEGGGGQKG